VSQAGGGVLFAYASGNGISVRFDKCTIADNHATSFSDDVSVRGSSGRLSLEGSPSKLRRAASHAVRHLGVWELSVC